MNSKSIEEFIVKLQPYICNTKKIMKTDTYIDFHFSYNSGDYVFTYFEDSDLFYVVKKDENSKFNNILTVDWLEDINYVDDIEQKTYTYQGVHTNSILPLGTDFSILTVEEFLKCIN